MPVITLGNGTERTYEQSVDLLRIAKDIRQSLAKEAIAAKVNGTLVDISTVVETDSTVEIITKDSPEGLEVIRHSSAHLLAQAVQQLYPEVQVTIGPVIKDGFYYDFVKDDGFTPDDLMRIEKHMRKIAKKNIPISRKIVSRQEAIDFFEKKKEFYKVKIIEDIPADEKLSLYTQDEFTDLCRGPHVPNTKFLKVFKLLKVSGAYWRGDSKNAMLQRIYGTAWATEEGQEAYLTRLEEALKRDHRKLGKQMNLFHLQQEAPGMVFWHEKGWILWRIIEAYMRQNYLELNYREIKTPQIVSSKLWEISGHMGKFKDEMFATQTEGHEYAIKPMNCPCHVLLYKQTLKSYRDLPLRLAEFGCCHRKEPSGALHGLMRLRGFTQDDGHIFCTEDHIQEEVAQFVNNALDVYNDFGFDKINIKIATRPEKRIGSDAVWDKAEQALINALKSINIAFETLPGEGAFYGPKIEFHLQDCLERSWQCGTIQVDFAMPERMGATYVDKDNTKKTPVMLHRAILGSIERFIAILLEQYAGRLPLWLSPVQARILTISDKQLPYAKGVLDKLLDSEMRVTIDYRNEKIGLKIREATLEKIPYLIIIGEKEQEHNTISLRNIAGQTTNNITISDLLEKLAV
ncbi:MAG: threonine--tRNA ligase [Thiotrichales bacterium]|nr:MAG: threonine--tRNA ligase [Thiotrichales bacterium]